MSNKNSDHYFLKGGGEMGELIREKDWSQTSLGHPEEWPESLSTMVAVMLNNPFGMYIAWGREYTQIYNDGYRPILGATKHPHALGISTRETFSEIWHIIECMFDEVMNGKAVGFPDFMLPLNRNGFVEECYFDFSYSPIIKNDGQVGGVLVTVLETTDKKKAEEALKESEQRFRVTVQQAPIGITILRGKEYVVEMANDDYLKLIDRERTEFVGRPLFDSLPEVEGFIHALLDGVMNTGIPFHGNEVPVTLIRYGKQEVFYFDFLYHPLKEKDGEISGIIVTVTEVTDKVMAGKKIRENENLLQSIFFNAPAAIAVITGPDHTYVLANNEYQNMVSRTSEQLVGKTSRAIFPELVGLGTFEIFDTIYQSGEPFSLAEYPVKLDKNNDGKVEQLYFRFSAVPLKDAAGKFDSIVIVAIDITEQVIARRKIEESQVYYQVLTDNTPVMIWMVVPDGNCTYLSKQWYDYTGQTQETGLGYGWLDSVHPDDSKEASNIFSKACKEQKPFTINYRLKSKEGEYRWHIHQGLPKFDKEGNFEGFIGSVVDIHEAVLARKKIEQSEQRLKAAIEAVQGILWTNNGQGEMEGEQLGWASLTGQTYEEYQGYGWTKAVHPDDAQSTVEVWTEAVRERKPFIFEHRIKVANGQWRSFSIRAIPIIETDGNLLQWVGVHTDITEQKLAEEKLAYRTALLEAHTEANIDGVLLVDAKGKILSFNQRFVELWNMPSHIVKANDDEAALSFAMTQLVNPQQFIDKVKYLYEHPKETSLDELEFKDGKILERNGYPVVGKDEIYYAWSWTFRDITEQRQSEKLVKESEERFRSLAQALPQLVWMTDAKGNPEFTSLRWKEYSGIDPDGEKEWKEIVHPDDFDNINAAWIRSLTTGNLYTFEVRLKNKQGEYRWHTVKGEPILDKENKISKWVGAFTDTHAEKTFSTELERQVDERTKELGDKNNELEKMNKELESFAYISSHDLQEPLRKIQTFATYLLEKEENNLSDTGKNYFGRMQKAAQRMQTLIHDLLAYSRTNSTERKLENTDLNKIIAEIRDDLKEELKEKNAIIEANQLGSADIIPFQFRQLMHNLISNSLKFSHPKIPPHIKVECEIAEGNKFSHVKLSPQGKYCHLKVSDNGIGFKPQYSERIFGLFQRLHGRDEYHGTGIGLSIVKKIVENHKGIILANGESNKGATFDIYFPTS